MCGVLILIGILDLLINNVISERRSLKVVIDERKWVFEPVFFWKPRCMFSVLDTP